MHQFMVHDSFFGPCPINMNDIYSFYRTASQHGISTSGIGIGARPSNRHQHPKDQVLSYKDALKQQVKYKVHKHLNYLSIINSVYPLGSK